MINTRQCRQDFLSILKQLKNLKDKNSVKQILKQINTLKKYINEEYFYSIELPQICHKMIQDLSQDLDEIDLWINKYFVSLCYDLPNEARQEKNLLLQLDSVLTNKYKHIANYFRNGNVETGLNNLIKRYKTIFEDRLVDKSFQEGLNILQNKKESCFNPQNTLETKIYNNSIIPYTNKVIKKYLCQSLISNIIFETKNSNKIDTQKLIKEVNNIRSGGIK